MMEDKIIEESKEETPLQNGEQNELKKKAKNIAVTCALVLAVALCISVLAQVLSKGYVSIGKYSLFRVVTGSMEPAISVGSLLISQDVDISQIQTGDVVNYRSKEQGMFGVIVTHRVIQILENEDGQIFLETKGDANQYADGQLVSQDNLVGQTVYFTKPGNFLAGLVSFLTSSTGFLACIVLPCLVLGAYTMRDCVKSLRKEMDGIAKQLDEVETAVCGKEASLEQKLGEKAYQELCDRLRGELLEELKQGAQTNTTEENPGAEHQ